MTPFALITPLAAHADAEAFNRFRGLAVANGYSLTPLDGQAWLAVGPGTPPGVARVGAWRLIGDVFPQPGPPQVSAPRTPEDVVRSRWGRYLAIRVDEAGRIQAVLRDPSGAVDALFWRTPDLAVVASCVAPWMLEATCPALEIDEAAALAVLHEPARAWDLSLLFGLESIAPGGVLELGATPVKRQVWRPTRFVETTRHLGIKEAGDLLRRSVDDAVAAFSSGAYGLAAEVSGGLDSSIVSSSLRRLDHPVRAWLHTYGADPEADERIFATGLAAKMGVALDCLPRPDGLLSMAELESLSPEVRPGFNAMDPLNDAAAAHHLQACGADVLLTGKGGDAVFLQAFGADVFGDLRRRRAFAALFSSTLVAAARWEGRSVWSVMAGAPRPMSLTPAQSILAPLDGQPPPHPWLAEAADLGPAKRLQIQGMIDGPGFSTASRQTAVVDLRHPLLSQPVVEACLTIPAEQLALGRDRGLARRAFADRLTPEIAARRSKGDLTAYYGRMIARSLPALRPWLLDGMLCAQGLLDRGCTDKALTAEQLIWRGGYREIMIAATMESWWRTWARRIADLRAAAR